MGASAICTAAAPASKRPSRRPQELKEWTGGQHALLLELAKSKMPTILRHRPVEEWTSWYQLPLRCTALHTVDSGKVPHWGHWLLATLALIGALGASRHMRLL